MSRTLRKYKGKAYREKSRKKIKEKKFFGHTSGTHSRKTDGVPKKGKDFVKYDWPFEIRHKKVIQKKDQEEGAQQEIKNARSLKEILEDKNLRNGFYKKYVGQYVKRFYTPFKEENIFEIKDYREHLIPDLRNEKKTINIPEFLYAKGNEEWWADVEDSVVITNEEVISTDERVANVKDPKYKGYNPFTKNIP